MALPPIKAYVGDKSWRKDTTFTSLGTSAANYSAANLKNEEMSRVWRSSNAALANTKFKGVFSRRRRISHIALCNHNFSRPSAKFRVKFYSDVGLTTLVADTEWQRVWKAIYAFNDPRASWGSGNWWGRSLSDFDIANRYLDKSFYFVDAPLYALAFTVEIDDQDNTDGFVEVGICEIDDGFLLPHGYEYGAQYGIKSRTEATATKGGAEYAEPAVPDDVFVAQSTFIDRDFVLGTFYEFQRRCDKHTAFWWSPDIEDERNALRHSYLARFNEDVGLLTNAAYINDNIPLNFKRVL